MANNLKYIYIYIYWFILPVTLFSLIKKRNLSILKSKETIVKGQVFFVKCGNDNKLYEQRQRRNAFVITLLYITNYLI